MATSRRRGGVLVGLVVGFLLFLGLGTATADPPPGYYDTVDATDTAALRTTLHPVIDDHTRFPYTSTSTDTWDILELADEDPTNPSNILDVYKNASYTKEGGGNSFYNREHSWPKSYGFPNDGSTNYPYTDCHALFLCDSGYNSSRSNKPFRDCSAACSEKPTDVNDGAGGGTGVYPGNSNWTEGSFENGTWETWIDRRGDVARAAFYMDMRYEGGTHNGTGASEPDLILTDTQSLIVADASNNQSIAYMGMLAVLYQWHLEDPVDDRERARNDVVFGFQGNRNPFVDHPEWVDCLYGGGSCGTSSGGNDPFINEFHYDNASTDVGELVEIAGPAGTDLTGWTVVGYNGNNGATYKTVNLSGVIPDQGGCMGTLSFTFSSMQNGAPDGLALVDATSTAIEFISYEGSFAATSGPASGVTSTDVGVSETGSTPAGYSIQRIGIGSKASDFTWAAPTVATAGAINTSQVFDACDTTPPAAPTGLAATAGNGFVDLDWNDNGEPDLGGYNIYRGTSAGGPYSPLNGSLVGASAYTDATVTNGTTYYYVVTAVDTGGNESGDSAETSATPDAPAGGGDDPFINEFHYDNASTDVGELVEIAGPAGTDLSGWSVVGYNGNGGGTYKTVNLSGVIPDQGGCMGTLSFTFSSMQNGAPDGLALVDDGGTAIEFISYEGSFTATSGPAGGMTSTDVGVSESGSTPAGYSIQRIGVGSVGSDFSWAAPTVDTPGSINTSQVFDGCGGGGGDTTPPAAPTGLGATGGDGVVDLDWADNGESDLGGYNIYRGTSAGGPYSKINGSLLASSAYSDTTVTNGTTYYYVVTAVDTSGNESSDSAEASATPDAPSGPTVLAYDDFESGWGSYTDGGGDCRRYTRGTHAWQGSAAADIQDNSGTSSSFYFTNGVDVATPGYTSIEINFWFKAVSMDNSNEDFWVQYFDGSTWHTVATYARGIDFDNNVFYERTVVISEASYTFPTNMKIRFMCDASGNADDVYIDAITVSAQ